MPDVWDEFDPSGSTARVLAWARAHGAETLGEAYDLLDQFEVSNDVPEVLDHDDTVDGVRAELEAGLEQAGPDRSLDAWT